MNTLIKKMRNVCIKGIISSGNTKHPLHVTNVKLKSRKHNEFRGSKHDNQTKVNYHNQISYRQFVS